MRLKARGVETPDECPIVLEPPSACLPLAGEACLREDHVPKPDSRYHRERR